MKDPRSFPTLPVPRGGSCSSPLVGLSEPPFPLHAESLNCIFKLLCIPQGHETPSPQICTLLLPGLALAGPGTTLGTGLELDPAPGAHRGRTKMEANSGPDCMRSHSGQGVSRKGPQVVQTGGQGLGFGEDGNYPRGCLPRAGTMFFPWLVDSWEPCCSLGALGPRGW